MKPCLTPICSIFLRRWLPAEHSADRATDRANWTTNTVTAVGTTTMPMMVLLRGATLLQERCMLRGIREAGFGITAFFLPASDGGPRRFFELAVAPDAEPQRGQPPLYFTARFL